MRQHAVITHEVDMFFMDFEVVDFGGWAGAGEFLGEDFGFAE